MNAFRKTRTIALVGLVALLTLGSLTTPAQAGKPFCDVYSCRDRAFYGNTLHFYPNAGLCGNYSANYCVTQPCFRPFTSCLTPVCYPVTHYDCFGRPYVVYRTIPAKFVR
jgi:hypothetical protein